MWKGFYLYIAVLNLQLVVSEQTCRCLSSDLTCWPNAPRWQTFNESIGGCLIIVRPSVAICSSNPPPNADSCAIATAQWTNASWRSDQPGAMQNRNWENSSCSAFLTTITCNQGSISLLAVNATQVEHIQTTLRFVSANNLRLVIKTSGHDYLGRSTAAGSLLLWLHYMKNINLIEQLSLCTGENVSNAVRLGAGVQWGEAYTWLAQYNLVVIGGASGTVGATGGFLQGGGHGPLTRWKGLAADQVLEFDVVTADGRRQTVNACQNSDLFWALRGGGGGTFAVVLSVVLRTFPSPSTIAAGFDINAKSETRYAILIRDFIRFLPTLADAGWAGYFYIGDTSIRGALLLPNGDLNVANATFNQFLNTTTDLSPIQSALFEVQSFYELYAAILAPSNPTGGNVLLGSRLIPETIVRTQTDQLADVFIRIKGRSENQSILIGHLVAGGQVANTSANNSVHPAWRTALLHMVYAQAWSEGTSIADQQILAERLRNQIDILQTMAGGSLSGSYMNEADPNEPDWQQKFFGTQEIYNRLKAIKQTVDPQGLFVCKNCVGSDSWSSDLNCPLMSKADKNHITLLFFVFCIFFLKIYI